MVFTISQEVYEYVIFPFAGLGHCRKLTLATLMSKVVVLWTFVMYLHYYLLYSVLFSPYYAGNAYTAEISYFGSGQPSPSSSIIHMEAHPLQSLPPHTSAATGFMAPGSPCEERKRERERERERESIV